MSPKVEPFSARGGILWARLLALLGSGLILVSCATRPQNPFDASWGGRVGDSAIPHRVRFEVSCRRCMISWRIGMDGETLQEQRTWSHAVYAYPQMGETYATLSASPIPGAGPVSWVRIRVDGRVVAEEKYDEDAGMSARTSLQTLSVETSIPPPARRPDPSWLTVHILEIDPIWDPLRDHPRFQSLLERYASDVERD